MTNELLTIRPSINGVIITIVDDKPVVSIECIDKEKLPELNDIARKVWAAL